ncbi:NAD(P)-dependent oxidoreductase [Clostridium sp. C8-1-8]|uniref:NAD(P)-dependent oxidoreductase n=1 Tax=Clostridium sp. C8-1-8 TaxID=2698831 RepID=UPI00136ACC00|nr:NAD(P)-dependent oxidoreductase [Clostridium sp. C8-1-8]
MHGDNKSDIPELDYMFLSLISNKINVIIVGGGKAAYIKAKSLVDKGCNLTIVSKEFDEEVEALIYKDAVFIKEGYDKAFILDKHLVFICIDDKEVTRKIINDCNELSKLYINCVDSKEGLAVMPMQANNKAISYAINTNKANPKMARRILRDIEKAVEPLSELTSFSTKLRQRMKALGKIDKVIMEFITSEEFSFFFGKGYGEKVLYLYFNKEYVDNLIEDDFLIYGGY